MSEATLLRPIPVLMLGQARRARLRDRAAEAALAWHRAWACEGAAAPTVEVSPGPGIRPRAVGREPLMLAAFLEEELLLHARAAPDFVKSLCLPGTRDGARTSSGADRSPPLEAALTEEALRALCEELIRAGLPSASCLVGRCGSATLDEAGASWQKRAITLSIGAGRAEGGAAVELHAAPRLADALAGSRPVAAMPEPMAARRRAADGERVSLTVTLGSASVAWRDLSALSIGDAIVLEQGLGAPCVLSVGGCKVIAEAHVGRADESRAVQVTRVFAAPAARTPSRES